MALLALIEDNGPIRRLAEVHAELHGHEIIAQAASRAGALALLHEVAAGERQAPDGWLLDANLSDTYTGDDARAFLSEKERLQVGGVTIGFSEMSMQLDYNLPVDLDPGKGSIPGAFDAVDRYFAAKQE